MDITLAYGKQNTTLSIDDNRVLNVLLPNKTEVELSESAEVERSLDNPIGTKKIEELFCENDTVCIVTSDITRPMPSKIVLPPVLKRLEKVGVKKENITIVFALGSHRKHTKEEQKYLVGEEIFSTYKLLDSDENDVVFLGETTKHTPVEIFRPVVEAKKVVLLGNIEYHYFAGYSGGSKAIMPGVSTKKAIRKNHSMMIDKDAKTGNIASPVRQDSEEVCSRFLHPTFIVNVVLDEHKKIAKSFAGDFLKAHRKGCEFLDKFYKINIPSLADIVVVSSGGYPKDLNMYQAQKALDNATHAIKNGGIIIWLADCKEGFGSEIFEKWMLEYTPEERIKNIKENFVLGGHKAAAIALAKQKAQIFYVGNMEKSLIEKAGLEYFSTLKDAFIQATNIQGKDSKVTIMPYGGSTLPFLKNN